MSYTQTFYHIVLRTHRSVPAIVEEHERELYSYMHGFIQNKGCHLYRIGGMPEHVHLFVSLPATLAMSKFVQELKVSSSKWLKASPLFPLFDGWTKEYAGFSKSYYEKDNVRAVQCGGGRSAVWWRTPYSVLPAGECRAVPGEEQAACISERCDISKESMRQNEKTLEGNDRNIMPKRPRHRGAVSVSASPIIPRDRLLINIKGVISS